MRHLLRFRVVLLLFVGFAVVGCSSDEAEEPAEIIVENADLSENVNERDLVKTRAHFNAARELWAAEGPSAYTMVVDSYASIQTEVADEVVLTMSILHHTGGEWEVSVLPQRVKDAFVEIDEVISRLEANPSLILPEGECGNHVTVRFDVETGVPIYYDTLSPCDDGVGVHISVTAIE